MQTSIGLTNHSSIAATALSNFAEPDYREHFRAKYFNHRFLVHRQLGDGGVNAGNLNVTADHLLLTGGGRLDANTFDAGEAATSPSTQTIF